jgi:hypothetical protein
MPPRYEAQHRSVFLRQEERRDRAIAFGDNPERIIAKALARPVRVYRIGRDDAKAAGYGGVVACCVFGADATPVASDMPGKADHQVRMRAFVEGALRGDDFAKGKTSCGNYK